MSSFPHQPHVQRGFEPEQEGYIAPREPSPYLAALFRFTSAVNAMDFDTITEVFDHKLVYSILPTSLQRPVLGYDMHLNYLDDISEMVTEMRIKIHEVIEENQKMMVQASILGLGRSERKYENEIIYVVHFEKISSRDFRKFGANGANWPADSLPKMVEVKEFVDSLRTKAWFVEERQWMKDNAQKVSEQRKQGIGEWRKDRWRRRQSQRHGQGTSAGLLGQPTQYAQGHSPTSTHYPQVFPPTPVSSRTLSSSRSQGQGGHGHSPTTTRGPTSTSLGNQGQGYIYTRPSPGYPASYNPYNKDKYSGV